METTVARKLFGSLEDLRAAHSSADLSFRQEEEEEKIILTFYRKCYTLVILIQIHNVMYVSLLVSGIRQAWASSTLETVNSITTNGCQPGPQTPAHAVQPQ